jgi:hypothetical protein
VCVAMCGPGLGTAECLSLLEALQVDGLVYRVGNLYKPLWPAVTHNRQVKPRNSINIIFWVLLNYWISKVNIHSGDLNARPFKFDHDLWRLYYSHLAWSLLVDSLALPFLHVLVRDFTDRLNDWALCHFGFRLTTVLLVSVVLLVLSGGNYRACTVRYTVSSTKTSAAGHGFSDYLYSTLVAAWTT